MLVDAAASATGEYPRSCPVVSCGRCRRATSGIRTWRLEPVFSLETDANRVEGPRGPRAESGRSTCACGASCSRLAVSTASSALMAAVSEDTAAGGTVVQRVRGAPYRHRLQCVAEGKYYDWQAHQQVAGPHRALHAAGQPSG